MTKSNYAQGLSRRNFLKGIGMIAGVAALAPIPYARQQIGGAGKTHQTRVGVMVPRSSIYPSMADDFTKGMKLHFDETKRFMSGQEFEIVTEDVGFGPNSIISKSQKLTSENGVDVVVGVMNPDAVVHVQDVFEKIRTPLVVSGLGENVARPIDQTPYVFYNTFNYWQSNWAAGVWSAENVGTKASIVVSFYDSGYDALYAFEGGFKSAGGEIVQTVITGVPSDARSLHQVLNEIGDEQPDLVFASYCGPEAADFMRAYGSSGMAGQVPLIGSGFLVDDDILPHQGESAIGVKTALSWSNTMRTRENGDFVSTYVSRTGKAPNAFSVLGYDTARLIDQAVQYNGGQIRRPSDLMDGLTYAEFDSPRGHLRMNNRTRSVESPIYLREVQRRGSGISNIVIDELKTNPEMDESILADLQGPKTGWLNAYLSV